VKNSRWKAWTHFCSWPFIAYAFVGVSISDAKPLGGEFLNESRWFKGQVLYFTIKALF